MALIPIAGGTAVVGGVTVAATSGWSTPEGLSAFITALVGLGALIWSITSARARQRGLDEQAAREIANAIREEIREERRRDEA